MAGLRRTREAELWMRDIFEYIAHDNPEVAARVVEGVYDRVQVLTEFLRIGHRYETDPGSGSLDIAIRTLSYRVLDQA